MTITIENEASKELPFDYKALIERVVRAAWIMRSARMRQRSMYY